MHENTVEPVVIFLPVHRNRPRAKMVIDPVCGRAMLDMEAAGRLRHGGTDHYFCSLGCAQRFAAEPRGFEAR
jgi:Cu+-exporting ATPase